MTPGRRFRHVSQCIRRDGRPKVAYRTEAAALRAAARTTGHDPGAYRCAI